MTHPVHHNQCEPCEGTGEVAIIRQGPAMFADMVGEPIDCTPTKMRERLRAYKGTDAGALTMIVRNLARHVTSTSCPTCLGTGNSYTLQQLDRREQDHDSNGT